MNKDTKTYVAGESLDSRLYGFVKLDGNIDAKTGNAKVVLATAKGRADGILYGNTSKFAVNGDVIGTSLAGNFYCAAGDVVPVVVSGTAKAKAGAGGVTVGNELAVAANGTVIPAVAGDYVVAIADQTANANEIFRVTLVNYKLQTA